MNANIFEKANQIIRACDAAYLGVIDEDGFPSVLTVSIVKSENIREIYFTTNIGSNKEKRLRMNNSASICFRSENNNITLVGTAEILTDQKTKSACWQDWFINHYSGGETDPAYCVIKLTTKRASLWIDFESAEFRMEELMKVQSRCGLLCSWCTYKESDGCGGCIETNGHPFHGECHIAVCCQNKGFSHCGECPDIPCELLKEYSYGDSEHCDNPKCARIEICKCWKNS